MSDMTISLSDLRARIGNCYTRQRLAQLSDFGKIPGASQKKGKRALWVYQDDAPLRWWIRQTKAKRKTHSKAALTGPYLKASGVAKIARTNVRQIERMADRELKEWHYRTPGGHHRFWNCEELRSWAKGQVMSKIQRGKPHRREKPSHSPYQSLVGLAAKMQGCLSLWRKEKPVAEWPPELRSGVKSQLEPIIRFYQSL
jgi:hypothetical protein